MIMAESGVAFENDSSRSTTHAAADGSGKFRTCRTWTSEICVVSEENLQEQQDEVLALQAIYNGSDEERVKVVSTPDHHGCGLFCMQVQIPVVTPSETCHIDLMLPATENDSAGILSDGDQTLIEGEKDKEEVDRGECMEEGATAMSEAPKLGNNIMLQRSLSGQKWTGSFEVRYLCPLTLQVTFTPNYPSEDPPMFMLSCEWLRGIHISSLCKQLDRLWQTSPNMPIVFSWVDWLENESFNFLGLTSGLVLVPDLTDDQDESLDGRAIPQSEDIGKILHTLLQYSNQKEAVEFCKSMQECCLCFDEKQGNLFFRLEPCKHHFCFDCIATHCNLHVTAGTVQLLTCPDSECKGRITPDILQTVLSPEDFIRWETLSLQRSLDEMDDIVYCPRCQAVVIREQNAALNLGYCLVCCFSFCTQCEQPWHQGSQCMSEMDRLDAKGERVQAGDEQAIRRFRELRRQAEEMAKSMAEIKAKTVPCPSCKAKVEKTGGCNKMTCHCGNSFCWICGKAIKGYDHFNSNSCVLFPSQMNPTARVVVPRRPPEALLWMQAQAEQLVDRRNREMQCTQCKQTNIKLDKNNHIHCWNCKSHLCFFCKSRITGVITQHFTSSGCLQHS